VEAVTNISANEAMELGAEDPLFFYKTFFPKTCRVDFAPFHTPVSAALETPKCRFINLQMFRGSAKTSLVRMYCARRIAYGMSKTIFLIGASEDHATRSVNWIKSAIDKNERFRSTFHLHRGNKWSETELEIRHPMLETSIWVKGAGITGNVRGVNFEDYRPDLILLDDVLTDENTATLEQREKISDLILGAVKNSLVTEAEDPNAKFIIAQTPMHKDDATMQALRDDEFVSVVVPCWTKETLEKPVDEQVSSWPERTSTSELRREKKSAMKRNRYSIFAREKECRLVTKENSAFNTEFLRYWDEEGVKFDPMMGQTVIAIDPVPPPSPTQLAKNLHNKDYEAVVVMMRYEGKYYLLDYETNRGHDPSWTSQTAERFARKYRPIKVVFEAIAFQRVLGTILQDHFRRRHIYIPVEGRVDKRPKYNRIISAFQLYEEGLFYVSSEHGQFLEDFSTYPGSDHDDLLDACASALAELTNPLLEFADRGDGIYSHVSDPFNEPLNLQRKVP
jgi:predicted phage terminase large subunit-like protein